MDENFNKASANGDENNFAWTDIAGISNYYLVVYRWVCQWF